MIQDGSSVAVLSLSVVSYVVFVLSLFVPYLLLLMPEEGCALDCLFPSIFTYIFVYECCVKLWVAEC